MYTPDGTRINEESGLCDWCSSSLAQMVVLFVAATDITRDQRLSLIESESRTRVKRCEERHHPRPTPSLVPQPTGRIGGVYEGTRAG